MNGAAFDAAIAALARRQHGTFAVWQVLAVGGTHRMIEHRIVTGRWVRLDVGVYALPGNPASWERQCWAAVLSHGRATLSGRAAAVVHRFPTFRPGPIEITVPRGADHRCRLAKVRQSDLVETTVVGKLPVTTVGQTLVDVARLLDAVRLGRLVDDLDVRRAGALEGLRDRYAALARSRLPGIGRVRAVLDERGDGYVPPESELEAVLWDVLAGVEGIPERLRQVRFDWLRGGHGRVDAVIPAWRAIIEGDGRRWHTRVADFEIDRARDNEAVLRGYRPLRFTWYQLTQRPHEVQRTVARLASAADRDRSGNETPSVWSAA